MAAELHVGNAVTCLYLKDNACNGTLYNVGSIETVDAVGAEDAALLTDCAAAVNPARNIPNHHDQQQLPTVLDSGHHHEQTKHK